MPPYCYYSVLCTKVAPTNHHFARLGLVRLSVLLQEPPQSILLTGQPADAVLNILILFLLNFFPILT